MGRNTRNLVFSHATCKNRNAWRKCSKQELKVEKEKAAELLLRLVVFPNSQRCCNSVCINIEK